MSELQSRLNRPYTTSTARLTCLRLATCSDTGTVAFTGRALDLSRALHLGTTGGKPLDVTRHVRKPAPRIEWVGVAVPLEINFMTSGRFVIVTATHQHRGAAAGASSTYATIKTDAKLYHGGTDTDAIFHDGFESMVSAQAIKRFYRCNLSFAFRLNSSTAAAAKDTTTEIRLVCNSPVYQVVVGERPNISVPATL